MHQDFANWKERDTAIRRRVQIQPCIPQHLFEFFPSPAAAYRRINKLRKRQRNGIRHVGSVSTREDLIGRPCDVYSNGWRPKPDNLFHEVMLTSFLLLYPQADVERGLRVNSEIRPDAEINMANIKYFVELDTGKQTHAQLRYKWFRRYRDVRDYLLFVTLVEEYRLPRVIQNAKLVHDIALFHDVRSSASQSIWCCLD